MTELRAIDMHVHLSDEVVWAARRKRAEQLAQNFGTKPAIVPAAELAEYYRSRSMLAVLMNSFDIDSSVGSVPNDHIAEVVAEHPDVFIGFGAVDLRDPAAAAREVARCQELGLRGIGELNAARQRFFPNDPALAPVWQEASDRGMPVLFHGGYPAAGAGTPGGSGVRLKYAHPLHLDDVAADFPKLTIICAHPSWPWEREALAVAMHKANVYLDLSGWAPKYLSDEVVRYVNSRIPRKVLFGSDWPFLTADRWIEEFEALDIKQEVRERVMVGNARELLGLQ